MPLSAVRTIRILVEQPLRAGAELVLRGGAGEHLTRVLRLAAGARVVLFNGDGHDYAAVLLDAARGGARVRIEHAQAAAAAESLLALTLVQGIARGEKMDWILQKATELGVTCIVPVLTARTEVKLDNERSDRRMTHWRGVIAGACEQCGRARLPRLQPPQPLAQWLGQAPGNPLLVLDPAGGTRVRDLPALTAACVLAGPEGGLDARDLDPVRAAGARGLSLGPRILRTETAGLAALAALQARFGDG